MRHSIRESAMQMEFEMGLSKMWLNVNGAKRILICDPDKDTLAAALRRM